MDSTIFFDGLANALMPLVGLGIIWFVKRGINRRPELAKSQFWFGVIVGASIGVGIVNFGMWLVTPDKSRFAHFDTLSTFGSLIGGLLIGTLIVFLIKRKYRAH